jgi:hypothetical protein
MDSPIRLMTGTSDELSVKNAMNSFAHFPM